MTTETDDFILLVSAQWERGLIVPKRIRFHYANEADASGLVTKSEYSCGSGPADCYSLTRSGNLRVAQLTGADSVYFGPGDTVEVTK